MGNKYLCAQNKYMNVRSVIEMISKTQQEKKEYLTEMDEKLVEFSIERAVRDNTLISSFEKYGMKVSGVKNNIGYLLKTPYGLMVLYPDTFSVKDIEI